MKFLTKYLIMAAILLVALFFKFETVSDTMKELHGVRGAELSSVSFEAATGALYPSRYDLREEGRGPTVRRQGSHDTCWAFASLSALESSLLPDRKEVFSPNHMVRQNSFLSGVDDGGDYTMAMAYLLSWQGPVREDEDPYEKGGKPRGLKEAVHVQEIRLLGEKDLSAIKEAVYLYGGVQSPIYCDLRNAKDTSPYYNSRANAYCYVGTEKPNHDVVIIGWDDDFPKESFPVEAASDGAFLCQNSWGRDFGEDGVFYISYGDANLGVHNIVYTVAEDTDNYDHIYQTDLCGWVGQIGYGQEKAYGANVYRAEGEEELSAVGFYATGKGSAYSLSLVHDFEDEDSFSGRREIARGSLTDAGYYTIRLNKSVPLAKGERFAVILEIETPESTRPLAVEYRADEMSEGAVLTDGEGYISVAGRYWDSAEKTHGCNLCLKAYTKENGRTNH